MGLVLLSEPISAQKEYCSSGGLQYFFEEDETW